MTEQRTTTALDPAPGSAWLAAAGWTFSLGIGLSACLLFTLEPMVGLQLLPILGGAPAVWATALAFFQLVLLAGYLYAHVSVTRLGRLGPVVHMCLAAAAGAALLVAPRMAEIHLESYQPILQVLGTLTMSIGLPAFLLCSTTPLLSAWLAAVLAPDSKATASTSPRDPYRLYVVSNAGSLLALLAYPLVIEPRLGLGTQRLVWNVAFALMVVVLAVVAAARLRLAVRAKRTADVEADHAAAASEPIPARKIVRWLFLAAVPCGLLSAVTNFITADLIATPMLWVGPLGIYLATFIVAFSERGRRLVRIATVMAPAMATLLWIPFGFPALWPTLTLLALELLGFGVVALTLHGALAADRPSSARLTMFYLTVSVGGVLGGSFVGLLAPVVFPAIWEYPILVAAAFLGMPAVRSAVSRVASGALPATTAGGTSPAARGVAHAGRGGGFRVMATGARTRLLPYAIVGVLFTLPAVIDQPLSLIVLVPLLLIGALILLLGAQPRMMATATALVLVGTIAVQPLSPIYRERDFFGVSEVTRNTQSTTLWHGTTNHGTQWIDPSGRLQPRGYYTRYGPLGDAMTLAQARGPQEIGIAGLGSGVTTAYERPVDHMTFFEIDPAVVRIASDPTLFTYLSQAPNRPTIVTGDARLEIAKVPDATYDLLILDAFSGDSIPTHLLTVEALRDDLRVLRPGGLLLIHVSNRFYQLVSAVAAGCQQVGLTTMSRLYLPTQAEIDDGATASEWVVAADGSDQLASLTARGWTKSTPADRPITDDFPDVLRFARFESWLTGSR